MLVIKYLQTQRLSLFITFTLALACASHTNNTNAEGNDKTFLSEPISPIPQVIEVNIARSRLGERLFFDTRLSSDNTISCASCHQLDQGGDDNLTVSKVTSKRQSILNTPTIFNVLFNFRQNWDGSAETLHKQVDMAVQNSHELNNQWNQVIKKLGRDNEFRVNFITTYPDGITKENIIDAIVEFEKTLITPNSRFDRYLRQEDVSLTKKEKEGYALFKELGCISCHQGTNVGGNLFQKFGLFYDYIAKRGNVRNQDLGRYNFSQRDMDKFVFKVPSLRNIAVTAPYLHDGSATTIEEAIRIMGKTQLGRTLSENEVTLIKSFLHTLTGEYNNKLLGANS